MNQTFKMNSTTCKNVNSYIIKTKFCVAFVLCLRQISHKSMHFTDLGYYILYI